MDDDPQSKVGEFDFLTVKQAMVLKMLAQNRTSKEIGNRLGVSETAVNRRIEVLRARLGGVTRGELTRRYRSWAAMSPPPDQAGAPCVETGMRNLQLARPPEAEEEPARDSPEADLAFKDSIAISIDAPWTRTNEPRVVPRVLDGDNAMLTRGAAIAIILLAIIASLVLGLAVAMAITEMLGH